MATYALMCFDKPSSLDLRMANRPAHLAYADACKEVVYGGPMLDDKGDMCGSLIVFEAPDKAFVEAFSAADPYRLAGLFAQVEIRQLRLPLGAHRAT